MASLAVEDLGTILSVWAHPDDEGYCCGGIMAMARRAGQRVVCVTATRGELGSTDPDRWPAGPQLAEVRTKELAAALAVLGVTEHHWLDYPDGGCQAVDQAEAVGRLRALVETVKPDTILVFGPDGATYHPDHIAVSRWVSAAVGSDVRILHQVNTPEWFEEVTRFVPIDMMMMVDREPVAVPAAECVLYVNLEGELLDLKFQAMLCQESQVTPLIALTGPEVYRGLLAEEAFTEIRLD